MSTLYEQREFDDDLRASPALKHLQACIDKVAQEAIRSGNNKVEVEAHLKSLYDNSTNFLILLDEAFQFHDPPITAGGEHAGTDSSRVVRQRASKSLDSGDHDEVWPATPAMAGETGEGDHYGLPDSATAARQNVLNWLGSGDYGQGQPIKSPVADEAGGMDHDDLSDGAAAARQRVLGWLDSGDHDQGQPAMPSMAGETGEIDHNNLSDLEPAAATDERVLEWARNVSMAGDRGEDDQNDKSKSAGELSERKRQRST